MAFTSIEPYVVEQAITEISTTKQHDLGTIIRAVDSSYGVGEFIYLLGVASTAADDWVTYNADDFGTTRLVADAIGPVAIAMGANVASSYGWYQISGKTNATCLTAMADNGRVFCTATAGAVDDASVTGDLVNNAKGASLSTATNADFEISRPWVDNNSSAT